MKERDSHGRRNKHYISFHRTWLSTVSEPQKHHPIVRRPVVALCSNLMPGAKGLMDQPKFICSMRSIFNDFFSHIEINYFMSPNMQIILLNERCLTSQIQLICKCKWGFICDILYGWEKTKRLLNSNTNCCDWLSHIIIHSESPKYQNPDRNPHVHTLRSIHFCLFIRSFHSISVHRVLSEHNESACVTCAVLRLRSL